MRHQSPCRPRHATIEHSILRCGALHFGGALETVSALNETPLPASLRDLSCVLLNGILTYATENQLNAVYWPAEAAAREIDGNQSNRPPTFARSTIRRHKAVVRRWKATGGAFPVQATGCR